VTNRCEIRCRRYSRDGNKHAKLIWKFDMMEEVGLATAQYVQLVAGVRTAT